MGFFFLSHFRPNQPIEPSSLLFAHHECSRIECAYEAFSVELAHRSAQPPDTSPNLAVFPFCPPPLSFVPSCTMADDPTPLASLSLTHVHYVSLLSCRLASPPSPLSSHSKLTPRAYSPLPRPDYRTPRTRYHTCVPGWRWCRRASAWRTRHWCGRRARRRSR